MQQLRMSESRENGGSAMRSLGDGLSIQPPAHALLKAARLRLGLSLQQVAEACSINIRQYQKFESGERDFAGCSLALGLRVCKQLELDPWQFYQSEAVSAKGARLEVRDDHRMLDERIQPGESSEATPYSKGRR